jgi:hypothetical protein
MKLIELTNISKGSGKSLLEMAVQLLVNFAIIDCQQNTIKVPKLIQLSYDQMKSLKVSTLQTFTKLLKGQVKRVVKSLCTNHAL